MSITVQELLDREMIRDVLADYSVTKDLVTDLGPSVGAFHPDGALERTDGVVLRGRSAIHDFFLELQKRRAGGAEVFARHWLYPCRFSFPSPDEAKTVTYLISFTETGLDQLCTYFDEFVKEDGRWYINYRRITMEYLDNASRLELPFTVSRVRRSAAR
jgi:hypothetical protein